MRDVFYWTAQCSQCGLDILLPDATFLQQPYSRGGLPTLQTPKLVACPHCKHVSIQDHFGPPDRIDIEDSGPFARQARVPCGHEGCGAYLIVIGLFAPKDDVREVTQKWIFGEEVRCSNGHHPRLFPPLSNAPNSSRWACHGSLE